jgi:hypothetical protein
VYVCSINFVLEQGARVGEGRSESALSTSISTLPHTKSAHIPINMPGPGALREKSLATPLAHGLPVQNSPMQAALMIEQGEEHDTASLLPKIGDFLYA